jgi:hypothetical protein
MAELDKKNTFHRIALYIGFIASFPFMVFIVNYQLDQLHRYTLLLLLIPLPFIFLFFGTKKPVITGILFIIVGVISIYMESNIVITTTRYIPGRGFFHSFYYTLFFVTLPLIAAGISYIISAIKKNT